MKPKHVAPPAVDRPPNFEGVSFFLDSAEDTSPVQLQRKFGQTDTEALAAILKELLHRRVRCVWIQVQVVFFKPADTVSARPPPRSAFPPPAPHDRIGRHSVLAVCNVRAPTANQGGQNVEKTSSRVDAFLLTPMTAGRLCQRFVDLRPEIMSFIA